MRRGKPPVSALLQGFAGRLQKVAADYRRIERKSFAPERNLVAPGVHLRHPFQRRCWTEPGDRVRFRIEDVFLPNAEGVFAPLPADTEVEGTILSFSDSGPRLQAFAVVEVVQRQTLIVPVERLAVCQGKTE